jgi:hypothetical protein
MCSVGVFGLLTAADAQTPSRSSAGAAFDGTYQFVSSIKLTEMFTVSQSGRTRPCPDWEVGPLTIVRGQRRFSSASSSIRAEFEGMVGSHGELAMRSVNPAYDEPGERLLNGGIDGTGTVRARLTGRFCNYDYVWRK